MKRKISVIFGTRPEAIKLTPVILKLKKEPKLDYSICVTAQHREMLDQVLEAFDIVPDVDLKLMQQNQSLCEFTAKAIRKLDDYYRSYKPDMVLIQGDTTTVFVAALTAFYHRVAVGHVEAGLRTGDLYSPWPEEGNRVLTSRLATLNFAPTERNKENLLSEGISAQSITVTGNTVIDALLLAVEKIKHRLSKIPALPEFLQPDTLRFDGGPRIILITGHRRENFGQGLLSICKAIARLARRFPDVHFVYPVHLNPNVRTTVYRLLGSEKKSNIHLIKPLGYLPFVSLMSCASLILTDSGGIQEEAPSLGTPVLIMRDTTERPEAIEAGTARIVGSDERRIVQEVTTILSDNGTIEAMTKIHNPYGDGYAADRILEAICAYYEELSK